MSFNSFNNFWTSCFFQTISSHLCVQSNVVCWLPNCSQKDSGVDWIRLNEINNCDRLIKHFIKTIPQEFGCYTLCIRQRLQSAFGATYSFISARHGYSKIRANATPIGPMIFLLIKWNKCVRGRQSKCILRQCHNFYLHQIK